MSGNIVSVTSQALELEHFSGLELETWNWQLALITGTGTAVFSDQMGKEDSDFIFVPKPRLRRISYEARRGCTDSIATSCGPSKSDKGETCENLVSVMPAKGMRCESCLV